MKKFIAAILIILTMLSPTCAMAKEYDPCDLDEADLLFVGDLLCLNAQLNAARSGGDYDLTMFLITSARI